LASTSSLVILRSLLPGRQTCPENNRRGGENAEKAEELCALCVFAVSFIGCGAPAGMIFFPEDGEQATEFRQTHNRSSNLA
jgi:hypothetical protein